MTLMFSYGSNLCINHMKRRCPAATAVSKFTLLDSRLVFRGVADCPYELGAKAHGAIWRITDACEQALDRYEGIAGGFYRKDYVPLDADNEYGETHLMLYVMNSDGVFPPAQHYLDTIAQGYRDFGLPMDALKAAVKHSHDHRQPSHRELKRHHRDGRPRLAPPPDGGGSSAARPLSSESRLIPKQASPDPGRWNAALTAWDRRAQLNLDLPDTSWDEWRDRKYADENGEVDLFDEGWEPVRESKTKNIRNRR